MMFRPRTKSNFAVHSETLSGLLLFLTLGIGAAGSSAGERAPYPQKLLWGDMHVHSSYSMDAGLMGNVKLAPDAAYRFARGEEVTTNTGRSARLKRPLDFLVVADHAEYMGLLPRVRAADATLLADPVGRRILEGLKEGSKGNVSPMGAELITSLSSNAPIIDNEDFKRNVWNEITDFADQYNEPGVFSALIGFEWSAMPDGDNLHRVVIYRDGADKAAQLTPVSAFDGQRPEDLWSFLENYTEQTGGKILAIPHNGNLSNGRMFADTDSEGRAIDAAYATRRARWEPLIEVTQIKGDGETHALLSPEDEFADFETWDKSNLLVGMVAPKEPWMLQYEYAREALKRGLNIEAKTGANPYRFGMIGGTDAHTSLATAAEDNFWGKAPLGEKGMDRTNHVFLNSSAGEAFNTMSWQQVAAGYTAAWTEGNTRAEIFDAFKRREAYATTGSRIVLRFFAGEYALDDIDRPDWVGIGYSQGVPMGAVIKPSNTAPVFLVMAAKDPDGANLDRIQIVKGWLSDDDELHEKVYTVAASNHRQVSDDGHVAPLASTINKSGDGYSNTTGAAQLRASWQDPDFNPQQAAFYYVRVLEIVTPRWTSYDAAASGKALAPEMTKVVQDRAYSSPIWVQPFAKVE
jgi:uncharacterized protein DUF3604